MGAIRRARARARARCEAARQFDKFSYLGGERKKRRRTAGPDGLKV